MGAGEGKREILLLALACPAELARAPLKWHPDAIEAIGTRPVPDAKHKKAQTSVGPLIEMTPIQSTVSGPEKFQATAGSDKIAHVQYSILHAT